MIHRRAAILPLLFLGALSLQCASNEPAPLAVSTPAPVASPAGDPPPFRSEIATMRNITTAPPQYGVDQPVREVPENAQAVDWPALHHPLLPLAGTGDHEEDQELERALEAQSADSSWAGTAELRAFADTHGSSRWTAAVALSLGDVAYQTARFSQALRWWQKAWELAKDDASPRGQAVAHQAIAEYAKMNARVGRQQEVRRVLEEVAGRVFQGDAAIKLDGAREGLWTMEHRPGVAFRCGPYALTNVLRVLRPDAASQIAPFLERVASPPEGFSLEQVSGMAPELGLQLQRVYRGPGSPILVPAVVHWSVGHFAALVEERDGLYRSLDPTFGNETWLTEEDLDAEASGYSLVPEGPLPEGFRAVDSAEASRVFGKGHSGVTDPDGTGPEDPKVGGDPGSCAMATHTFHTLLASSSVSDTPIRYQVASGPEVAFRVTYNQREAAQPVAMEFTNFSPNWVSTWVSYIEDEPAVLFASVSLRQRGGGGAVFTTTTTSTTTPDTETPTFGLHAQTKSNLRRLDENSYVREYSDGSREYYEQYIGTTGFRRRVFLSRVVDPAGNQVSLRYDATRPTRLQSIVDAVGLTTTLSYDYPGQPYLVTSIRDPFGRLATFSYADDNGTLRLSSIRDAFGIASSFGYGSLGINRLTTPYGTTTFNSSPTIIGSGYSLIRFIEATDPEGNKERIEYNLAFGQTGLDGVEELYPDASQIDFTNGDLDDRNSFYWDKYQMKVAPGDYRAAHLYHWVQPDAADAAMAILESEKPPLEGRIWYNYTGQLAPYIRGQFAQPSAIGRVVVDESGEPQTQVSRFEYNAFGNVTQSVDAVGRETQISYADNGIDVVEVRQKTGPSSWETIQKATFAPDAPPHLPTSTTDGSGKTTLYTYNAAGQVSTIENPLGQRIQPFQGVL